MTPAEVATAVVLALGGATIIPKLVDGIRAWKTGRAKEEKLENRTALGRLADAERRRDDEANFRRRLEEYASSLRRMLLELGVPENKIPEWPTRQRKVRP